MNKRNTFGNYIFMAGVFFLLMFNLNYYDWYVKMRPYNYIISAVVLTVVFLCYVNLKDIIKDKLLWAVIIINAMALLFVMMNGGVNASALTVYIFTLGLYLFDKVRFSKRQIYILSAFIGLFFIYWTIDVKGYFKGYSINFGGLVLIAGFVYLLFLLEMLKYNLINDRKHFIKESVASYLKKYPYYITFVECILFAIGAKIISYYQSRTGMMVLMLFALLLILPKTLIYKKITRLLIIAGSVILTLVLPYIYINIAATGKLDDVEIFYRPLIGARGGNWQVLYSLVRENWIKGLGTVYITEGSPFREGFLDCCNGPLQIAAIYGVIVAILTIALLIYVLYKQSAKIVNNPFAATAFLCTVAFILASASESFIVNPIFVSVFAGMLYIVNSFTAEADSAEVTDIYAAYKKMAAKEYRNRFIPVFCVTLMISIMYLILGPLEIFYSNYLEFEFNTIDFILYFIAFSVAAVLAVSLILSSVPKIISDIYCTLMLGISIASYIQYMFLNATLSDVNGTPEFGPLVGPKYYISIVVFILAIVISIVVNHFVLKKYKEKIYTYVSLGLSLVMATAVITVAIGLLGRENKPDYSIVFDATDEYVMGREENTIVLVLDTFGRDILEEELSEHPDALNVLHDFTYYDKEDSEYAPTFPSFVHFLTGHDYNGEERSLYEREAFDSESSHKFFDEIADKGYRVKLNTRDILTGDYMQYIADNIKPVAKKVNKKEVRRVLANLSIYRYVPYFLKSYFYVQSPGVFTVAYDVETPQVFNQTHFSRLMNGGMSLSDSVDKLVSIHHYYGMHKSYMNDEYCQETEPDTTTRWQTMQGLWLLVDTYFDKLKENGIYDNSTIIVMSDHGICYDHTGYDHFYTDAIFFIKKPGETHDEVLRNHDKMTHSDFQQIILNSLK